MILLVDNNEFRREEIQFELRRKGIMTCSTAYDELRLYTKPLMTVYLRPHKSFLQTISHNDKTETVIVRDKIDFTIYPWMNIISLEGLVAQKIIALYNEKITVNKPDKIDITGIICVKNSDIAVGGKMLYLAKRELKIARMFIYNPHKTFNLYELCQYIHIASNPEENFIRTIKRINSKCKSINRGEMINIIDKYKFKLNDELLYD